MTELSFKEIENLKSNTDKPVRLVWTRDGAPVWRIVCFYFPSEKVYALDEKGDPGVLVSMARLWAGNRAITTYSGDPPFRLPLPKGARLIWLISPDSVDSLARIVPLQKAPPLYYTDLAPDAPEFRIGSFEFVPQ